MQFDRRPDHSGSPGVSDTLVMHPFRPDIVCISTSFLFREAAMRHFPLLSKGISGIDLEFHVRDEYKYRVDARSRKLSSATEFSPAPIISIKSNTLSQ